MRLAPGPEVQTLAPKSGVIRQWRHPVDDPAPTGPTLSQVQPDGVYTAPQIARMLGLKDPETVRVWIRTGRLKALPAVTNRHRVLGSEVLKLTGPTASPRQGETAAQRQRREDAAMADIERLTRRKPGQTAPPATKGKGKGKK